VVGCSREDPAVLHRCFEVVEAAVEYSREDPVVAGCCLDLAEGSVSAG
jgi:hypothetical protein